MSETPPSPAAKRPDLGYDALKGIGTLAVLGIHSLNNSARLYAEPQSQVWMLLSLTNRILNFAVPFFLVISAVLYARSQSSRDSWDGYLGRRVKTVVYPYLVWSCIYLLVRFFLNPSQSDHQVTQLFGFQGPKFFLDWRGRLHDLLWGKAAFHLYFMSILIQFGIVFPLLYSSIKRIWGGYWSIVVLSFLLQAGVFWSNKHLYTMKYPGATFLWYVSALLPAIWIGLNAAKWESEWPRNRWLLGAVAVLSGTVFLYVAALELRKLPFSGDASNTSLQIYTFSASVLLLGLIIGRTPSKLWTWLSQLGTVSLQVYLVHPLFMKLMETSGFVRVMKLVPLPYVWAYLLLLLLSLSCAKLFTLMRLDALLFGRSGSPIKRLANP